MNVGNKGCFLNIQEGDFIFIIDILTLGINFNSYKVISKSGSFGGICFDFEKRLKLKIDERDITKSVINYGCSIIFCSTVVLKKYLSTLDVDVSNVLNELYKYENQSV